MDKKKLHKSELALRHCKAPQYTNFFIEIGCLGTYNVEINRKIEKFKILEPGGLCLLQPVKNALRTKFLLLIALI